MLPSAKFAKLSVILCWSVQIKNPFESLCLTGYDIVIKSILFHGTIHFVSACKFTTQGSAVFYHKLNLRPGKLD